MKLSSIKARVTALTIMLVGVLWLVAAAMTWFEARHEAEEVFDAHLAQSAALLIAQTDLDIEEDHLLEDDHVLPAHRYAMRVAFQVWVGDRLQLHSANAPDVRLSGTTAGFSNNVIDGVEWRVFSSWNRKHQRLDDEDDEDDEEDHEFRHGKPDFATLVQVGELMSARKELADTIAAGLLYPLFWALPLLAVLIWLAVWRGVRPLDLVSVELERRSASHLDPLPVDALPAEVKPLVERLNALFHRVEQTFEQERRFTADAAHELRTPLAGIRAQAQVGTSLDNAEARNKAFASVIEGCDRMTHLVEQLLVLARVDAAQATDFARIELGLLVRDTVAQSVPVALVKGVEIEVDAENEVWFMGNETWFAVLVRNLVENAIRYSPEGTCVRVRVFAVSGGGQLCVEDQGPGVPTGQIAMLGQRFHRVLGSDAPGSGLGLSIVRRIAMLHGAAVEFSTGAEGRGLRVDVKLAAPSFSPQ